MHLTCSIGIRLGRDHQIFLLLNIGLMLGSPIFDLGNAPVMKDVALLQIWRIAFLYYPYTLVVILNYCE